MGPRSHERGNILADSVAMHGDLMLQWGRVLMNAETRHDPSRTRSRVAASMGPRSHERGNATSGGERREPEVLLQWGRVLMNAETHPPCSSDGTLDSLQWGRVLMNAETRTANSRAL